MLDGIFVFDNAIHCYDMSDENLRADVPDARYSRDLLLDMGAGGRWAGYNDGSIEFRRRWTVEELYKGIPFGLMDIEAMRPNDLQRPARDFPELKFVIHHLALPYFEEAVWIAARFPNIYLSLAANLNFTLIAPRAVQQQLGQLLQMVGSEKLCYASDAALSGGPAPYLHAFMELEIPHDLRDGFGFPQITRRDRENILGLTFARLMGIDVEAKHAELAAGPV